MSRRTRSVLFSVAFVQGQLDIVERLLRSLEQHHLPDGRTLAVIPDEVMDWLAQVGASEEDLECDEREPTTEM